MDPGKEVGQLAENHPKQFFTVLFILFAAMIAGMVGGLGTIGVPVLLDQSHGVSYMGMEVSDPDLKSDSVITTVHIITAREHAKMPALQLSCASTYSPEVRFAGHSYHAMDPKSDRSLFRNFKLLNENGPGEFFLSDPPVDGVGIALSSHLSSLPADCGSLISQAGQALPALRVLDVSTARDLLLNSTIWLLVGLFGSYSWYRFRRTFGAA